MISIVIAVRNEGPRLIPLLESIVEHASDSEILIWDGDSQDDTLEHAAEFRGILPRLRIYSGVDSGIYHAWNILLTNVTSPYVIFLGVGDRLIRRLPVFPDNQSDCIYSLGVSTNANSRNISIPSWRNYFRCRFHGIPSPNPGTVYPYHRIVKLGLFNIRFRVAGDYDIQLRHISCGGSINRTYASLVYVEHSLDGISSDRKKKPLILAEMAKSAKCIGYNVTSVYLSIRAVAARLNFTREN